MGSDWQEYKLADLCDSIDYGFTTSAKDEPVGPKFLRITDIVTGHIDWNDVPYCESDQANTKQYLIHDKDIVVARTGANTGSSVFVSSPPEAVFASYLVRLKISDKANSRFISYFLKSPEFWAYMQGVLGDKSAQPNASAKTMTQVKLKLPPNNDQQAISHILGSLDDKIALNRRMNETLEATARAIFESWFVDFDPVRAKAEGGDPGLPDDIAALFPDSFKNSELGGIPMGWKPSNIGSEFDLTMGQSPPSKTYNETGNGLPFFQGRRDFGFRYPSNRVYCAAPQRLADHGDTLVSVRAPVGDINMAMERCCVGRGVAGIRHKSGSRSYTYYAMHTLSDRFARFEA